jgi:small-conductance mechanosensitive channel
MIAALRLVVVDCAVIAGAALVLAIVLRFGRALLASLPTSRARRAMIERVAPLAGTAIAVVFVAIAARWILRTEDQRAWIAIGAVATVIVLVSWGPLRDVFEGIYLRAGRTCAIGDRVQIGAVRGRIQRLGLRGLHVEGSDGTLAIVPYRALAAQTMSRTPGLDHPAFHVFRIPIPVARSIADVRKQIVEAALLHHWASVARLPLVVATEHGELEVTVFAVDPDRVADLEAAIRNGLTKAS